MAVLALVLLAVWLLLVVGIAAATLAAQLAMGASWRPDVDPTTRTPLVASGPG